MERCLLNIFSLCRYSPINPVGLSASWREWCCWGGCDDLFWCGVVAVKAVNQTCPYFLLLMPGTNWSTFTPLRLTIYDESRARNECHDQDPHSTLHTLLSIHTPPVGKSWPWVSSGSRKSMTISTQTFSATLRSTTTTFTIASASAPAIISVFRFLSLSPYSTTTTSLLAHLFSA